MVRLLLYDETTSISVMTFNYSCIIYLIQTFWVGFDISTKENRILDLIDSLPLGYSFM
jgi:hypothetical protein